MRFVVGYLDKLIFFVKTKPKIFWVSFFVVLILAGCRLYDFHRIVSQTVIQISMKSSVDGTAQLYYDVGSGLSEKNSVTVSVIGDQNYHDYQFRLPRLSIYGMRFDPLMSEGSVAIRYVRRIDGLGAVMQSVNLTQLKPLNHIGSFTVTDQEVKIVTDLKVNDPQIGVPLDRPLTAGRVFSLTRHPMVILRILIECIVVFFVVTLLLSFWLAWRKNIVWLFSSWRRNIALLFSRGEIPLAMLFAFIIIIVIEVIQQIKLPPTASYHEVDALLHHLQAHQANSDYMLLGDSVGRQLFINTPDLQNEKYAMLATNQAVTMTGQYFIAKRYLQDNKMPRAVILLTSHGFGDLNHNLADNYIQRTFVNFSEIFEIFMLKRDPVYTTKMLAYRLLPSFKYRLFLQKHWVGFTNAESLSGIPYDNQYSGTAKYSLLRIIQSNIEKKNIPLHHFKVLLTQLNNLQIPLFFLVPAVNEHTQELYREYRNLSKGLFPELQKRYPDFHYDDEAHLLRREYYVDGSHFNEAGLKIETQRLREKMINIERLINQ